MHSEFEELTKSRRNIATKLHIFRFKMVLRIGKFFLNGTEEFGFYLLHTHYVDLIVIMKVISSPLLTFFHNYSWSEMNAVSEISMFLGILM